VLFPYIKDSETEAYILKNSYVNNWFKKMELKQESSWEGGLATDDFPLGLSKVPVKWKYLIETFEMEFVGGFVGVSQDQETCAVRPGIGSA
jgi:Domain of unknown function (DUF4419)